jgi:cell division protease FtsH
MSRFFKSAAFPILIVVVIAFFAAKLIGGSPAKGPVHSYRTLVTEDIPKQRVKSATLKVKDNSVAVTLTPSYKEEKYEVGFVDQQVPKLEEELRKSGAAFNVEANKTSIWPSLLSFGLPLILILGFWFFLINQMQGGGSRVMSFGKSRAKRLSADSPKITFRDVAGVDEAVEELHEIKEFLENPKKFQALGARIPTGVLLYGPPGTGKTLLARAVAGEAGVPFFSISGSDFVEMFVGVGASRVRDLFEQAKQNSPCIIFMDEIDAVGRHRGAGLGGGHDEREQTLNQLLVEMDGFEAKDNIIMIAATNRPDILDPALLRPGRFDRQIAVDRPDRKGRAKILEVHTRGKPLGTGVDLGQVARQTSGLTGAELANICNEAAIFAGRRGDAYVTQKDFDNAIERVVAGLQQKKVLTDKERRILSYHEGGHALMSHLMGAAMELQKVTIVSRGDALGYAFYLPEEDRYMQTKEELIDRMIVALAGRAAEEVVFGRVTNGAASDLEKVTEIARAMVFEWGMSESVSSRTLRADNYALSEETKRLRDSEQALLTDTAYAEALRLLKKHRGSLDRLASALLEKETLVRDEVLVLLADVEAESRASESVGVPRVVAADLN